RAVCAFLGWAGKGSRLKGPGPAAPQSNPPLSPLRLGSGHAFSKGEEKNTEGLLAPTGARVFRPGETEHLVPIQARHICLLFRRFISYQEDMTRPYVEALEARGIPHLLVGGRSFHNRAEIETLRAALAAIEWPEDELSVFATF